MESSYQLPPLVWHVLPMPWGGNRPLEPIPDLGADQPSGAMASHLGRRLSPQELRKGISSHFDEDPAWTERDYAKIWAYELPELVGSEVRAWRADQLPSALASRLTETLDVECHLSDGFGGALGKYGILDATVPAPPFCPEGAPMAIQIFGPISRVGEHEVIGVSDWVGLRHDRELASRSCTVRIAAATYANLCGLGIGVPFYM